AIAACWRRAGRWCSAGSWTPKPARSQTSPTPTAWCPPTRCRSTAGPPWDFVRRFTISPERISGDRVTFDADETRHLARVLRLGPGDVVTAADGRGGAWEVRLTSLGETATGTIVGAASLAEDSPLAITLVQAVPKGDR